MPADFPKGQGFDLGPDLARYCVMNNLIDGLNEQETQLMRLMYSIAVQDSDGVTKVEYLFESFLDAWFAMKEDEAKTKPHLTLIHPAPDLLH